MAAAAAAAAAAAGAPPATTGDALDTRLRACKLNQPATLRGKVWRYKCTTCGDLARDKTDAAKHLAAFPQEHLPKEGRAAQTAARQREREAAKSRKVEERAAAREAKRKAGAEERTRKERERTEKRERKRRAREQAVVARIAKKLVEECLEGALKAVCAKERADNRESAARSRVSRVWVGGGGGERAARLAPSRRRCDAGHALESRHST